MLEERRYVTGVLMDHGVSASVGKNLSKRASLVRKQSHQSIASVSHMISAYERELEEYRLRLLEME